MPVRQNKWAILLVGALLSAAPLFGQSPFFAPGNLVVVVEGCGVHGGTCNNVPNGKGTGDGNSSIGGYGDNQGAPITLFQYSPAGTAVASFVNSLVLPQAASGANFPVSGEYGSSSEGTIQLSGGGQYLTLLGYGIAAATFNANPDAYGAAPSEALAQSGSLTGQSYTPVARVLALIDANGNVNSSTAIFNIFNTNNPRSAYTQDGITAYVSGQGSGSDATGGVFLTAIGAPNSAPTAITGLDTTSNTIAQDTRDVQIFNNTLYISVDSKEGSGSNRDFIGTLGAPPATGLFQNGAGPSQLSGFATSNAGKLTISNGNGNNVNSNNAKINLSPVSYFFATLSVLYVADSGNPKNDSNGDNNGNGTANIGNGGLQKWTNSKADGTGTWSLKYTLYGGLNLVNNANSSGSTGLYGLAGVVFGNSVLLYATNYTLNDLDQTYLYGITDTLNNTTPPGAALKFALLDTAPADSNFKGVSFAPSIPAGSVEVTSAPSGLAFTSAAAGCAPGIYTTPQTLAWVPGSNCTLSVVTPQVVGGVSYGFSQWADGTFFPTDSVIAPQTSATYTAEFVVQTTPTIAWPAISPITFGSALSGIQLNATASVPGAFAYNPPAGTVPPVGTNEPLSVTFTPDDAVHYTTATGSNTITVNPAPQVSPANLAVTRTLARIGGNVVVQIAVANTGGTDASNVTLTSAKVGADTAVPLPQNIGTIAAGTSVQVTVSVPGSVGASGAASSLSISGTYTGGTFSTSGRITLP